MPKLNFERDPNVEWLDFKPDIARLTQGFVGREWVVREIDRWLATSNASRFSMITGEPGIDKSHTQHQRPIGFQCMSAIHDRAAQYLCQQLNPAAVGRGGFAGRGSAVIKRCSPQRWDGRGYN